MEILKNKKGGFEDIFFLIVVLFAVIIFLLILSKTWTEIKTPLNEGISASMPSNGINITKTLNQVSSSNILFDRLVPFLLIGLLGFLLVGASAYLNHPILAFVGLIILAVAVLLGVVYSNVYHQIASSDEFSSTTAEHPIGDKFMQYLPIWILIAFVGIVVSTIWLKSSGGTSNI
jgi:hypothetical protein